MEGRYSCGINILNKRLDKKNSFHKNESMKKLMAQMIIVFLVLEIATGILLVTTSADMGLRGVIKMLHRSIFSFAYLAFVVIHCWMLRNSIAEQLKKGKLDAKYVIILALLALSVAAFIPGKVFGPYPISLIVHGIAIPAMIAVLIWMHIIVQKKAKAEREKLQQQGNN